jgi:hypothetical protein
LDQSLLVFWRAFLLRYSDCEILFCNFWLADLEYGTMSWRGDRMKVGHFLAAAVVSGSLIVSARAAQIPIGTTGYNQDFIVGVGETFPAGATGLIDNGAPATTGNTWYGVGQNVSAPTTGLPVLPYVSESDANTTLLLKPSNVSNTLLIDSTHTTGTLTLTSPAAYSTLSTFASTGNGTNTLSYVFHYSDSSTHAGSASVSAGDWFNGSNVAVTANGRINEGGYDNVNAGNPRLYQINLDNPDSTRILTSVDFTLASGGGHTGILALSGALVPEPTSLGFIGLGLLGLMGRRRKA